MFQKIAKIKVYFSRAGMYLSILNFLMLLATFKLSYGINISVFIIIPVGFFIALLLGYLDYSFVMKHEIEHSNLQNNIKNQLDKIESILNEMKH